jgi:hypothetical protein
VLWNWTLPLVDVPAEIVAFEKLTPPWQVKHESGRLWNSTSPRFAASDTAWSSRAK